MNTEQSPDGDIKESAGLQKTNYTGEQALYESPGEHKNISVKPFQDGKTRSQPSLSILFPMAVPVLRCEDARKGPEKKTPADNLREENKAAPILICPKCGNADQVYQTGKDPIFGPFVLCSLHGIQICDPEYCLGGKF